MLLKVNLNIKIAWWATINAMFTFANQPYTITLIDARRNLDGQCLVLLDATGASAALAWLRDVAASAVTFRAGLLDREESLLQTNLTRAVAGRTSFRLSASFGAATVTGFADLHGRNTDLCFRAMSRLFQRDFQVVAEVSTTIDIGATAPTAAAPTEYFIEDAAEGIPEAAPAATAKTTGLLVDTRMAVLLSLIHI